MNSEVALTHNHWMETLRILQRPDQNHNTRELARICESLIDINKHDPQTIEYLNNKAEHMLSKGETL